MRMRMSVASYNSHNVKRTGIDDIYGICGVTYNIKHIHISYNGNQHTAGVVDYSVVQ